MYETAYIRLTQARIVRRRAAGNPTERPYKQVFFMATLMVQHFHTGVWTTLVFVRHHSAGRHYARVLGGTLPPGCPGRGHPGQRLGPPGGNCRPVCANQARIGRKWREDLAIPDVWHIEVNAMKPPPRNKQG